MKEGCGGGARSDYVLALCVWLVSWYAFWTVKSLFTGRLRSIWVFSILTIAPLISESPLGNTSVTMTILQKCLGTFSSKTSTILLTLIFREFDTSSRLNLSQQWLDSWLSQKWLLMWFILSVVLERMVRFLSTVDAMLEEYNKCLPNNKWLGVKHISIVLG